MPKALSRFLTVTSPNGKVRHATWEISPPCGKEDQIHKTMCGRNVNGWKIAEESNIQCKQCLKKLVMI